MNKFSTNVKIDLIYAYQHMAVDLLCKSIGVDYKMISNNDKTSAMVYFDPFEYEHEEKDTMVFLQSKGYVDIYNQIIDVQRSSLSHDLRTKIVNDLLEVLFDTEEVFLKAWIQETGLLPSQSKVNTIKTPDGYSMTITRIEP